MLFAPMKNVDSTNMRVLDGLFLLMLLLERRSTDDETNFGVFFLKISGNFSARRKIKKKKLSVGKCTI